MLTTSKTININGISSVEINGTNKVIAYFNAQIQLEGEGKHTINKAIQDEKLYAEHKSTVKADYDEFETMVETYTETE